MTDLEIEELNKYFEEQLIEAFSLPLNILCKVQEPKTATEINMLEKEACRLCLSKRLHN